MTAFLSGYVEEDESVKNQAIAKYNEDVQALVFELNEEHLKVKSEQNSIRLIASFKVDSLLDNLEIAVENATDSSAKCLEL
tara:strand:- start:318 stop:560 length:243 start_codon:yes stop_codon:yes gene_type:complete